jgi:lantibiotic transport system ATP-binding protein
MDSLIHLEDVWKAYGSAPAVRGLKLDVPPQSVYGFLGPNGAGKSTTIRMILGLQRPDRGTLSLFGQSLETTRLPLLRRVGSLVESPSLYMHLTGRENLEVHRRLLALPKVAIDEVLETVALERVGDRLVCKYSSGMKQRLGLAQALLGHPELLVLDEPTNGLDPAGIHEVRSLIHDLPKRSGVTVFLSSHLLAEVEQVATDLAIVAEGRLMFEGTRDDLTNRSSPTIRCTVNQPQRALALLRSKGHLTMLEGDRVRIAPGADCEPADINSILVSAGIAVSELVTQHPTLEDSSWN